MTTPHLLHSHPRFVAASRSELCDAVEGVLHAQCVRMSRQAAFRAVGNWCPLPSGELWFCSYGVPLTLRIPEGDYIRVQFQAGGKGLTRGAAGPVAVTDRQACVSSGAALIEFPTGFRQLVWRIARPALLEKLRALSGDRVVNLDLEGPLQLDRPEGRMLSRILGNLVAAVDDPPLPLTRTLVAELEQALIVSFLGAAPEAMRHLSSPAGECSALFVRRVEEYIEAHWDGLLRMEDLTALTGESVRTLYRAFQRDRGYSPLEFQRRVRLREGRRMLEDPGNVLNIAQIAATCGFVDGSHFGKAFAREFGMSPSAARQRWHRTDSTLR